jgi:hypothetical protein
MRFFGRAAAFMLLLPALVCAASPIDGAWAGRFDGDPTSSLITFVLKTDGNRVTGSIAGADIKLSIEDGTVADTTVQFNARPAPDAAPATALFCTGTLTGDDTIKMTCQADGQPDKEFVIRRQKQT